MKIKVFRFEVNNASSECFEEDKYKKDAHGKLTSEPTLWYFTQQQKLFTEDKIEEIINDFIKDKKVIDIKVNDIEVKYHNNARGNTIHLVYTIMYAY